jgi:hypothetical protein
VVTSAGAIEVAAPRINDRRVDQETGERPRFRGAILPRRGRRSPKVNEVLPLHYLNRIPKLRVHTSPPGVLGTEPNDQVLTWYPSESRRA